MKILDNLEQNQIKMCESLGKLCDDCEMASICIVNVGKDFVDDYNEFKYTEENVW